MSNHRMTSWLKVSCCNSIIIFNLNARYMLRFRKFILSYWSRAVINRLGCCKHSFIMINLLENIIFFKFTIPFSMLHFFVFQTLSVTNLTLSSNDMTYGICTWMQAIVSNHLKQKRKFQCYTFFCFWNTKCNQLVAHIRWHDLRHLHMNASHSK